MEIVQGAEIPLLVRVRIRFKIARDPYIAVGETRSAEVFVERGKFYSDGWNVSGGTSRLLQPTAGDAPFPSEAQPNGFVYSV